MTGSAPDDVGGAPGKSPQPGAASEPSAESYAPGSRRVENQWYYAAGGQSYGPVTEKQLDALARAGHFRKDDYVYAAYIGGWVRADSVHGLFDEVGVAAGAADAAAEPLYVPPASTPPGLAAYAEYAGVWIRLVAVVIDGFVLALPCCIIVPLTTGVAFRAATQLERLLELITVFAVLGSWLVVPWLYFSFMESSAWQATVGKRAAGIVVTDVTGVRISFIRATVRFFASLIGPAVGYVLALMVFLLGGEAYGWFLALVTSAASYLLCFVTARKQAFHDVVAGTLVFQGRTS